MVNDDPVGRHLYSFFFAFLLCLFCLPRLAEAHPHVFVEYTAEIVAENDTLKTIHFIFRPKSFFSSIVTVYSEVNGDPNSRKMITHVYHDDYVEIFKQTPVTIFLSCNDGSDVSIQVELHLIEENEKDPIYGFDVSLPTATTSIAFSMYDPSYYIALMPSSDEVLTEKPDGFICAAIPEEVPHEIWGQIGTAFISCDKKENVHKHIFMPHPERFDHPLYKRAP